MERLGSSVLNSRNYAIDVVKLLGAIVVLCSHSIDLVKNVPQIIVASWIAIGTPVVQLFFCISGFFMIESYYRSTQLSISSGEFAIRQVTKKFKSIFPYYIIPFILFFITRLYLGGGKEYAEIYRMIVTAIPEVLGLSGVGMKYQYFNSVTWYISAMLLAIWICSYILHKNSDFYIYVFAPVTFILIFAYEASSKGTIISWNEFSGLVMNSTIRGVEGICMGAIMYLIKQWICSKERNKFVLTIIEIIGYSLVFFYFFVMKTDRNISLYITLLFPILLALTASNNTITYTFFNRKIFSLCGIFSLLIYLSHYFVKIRVVRLFFYDMEYKYAFLIYVACTVFLSCAIYIAVDKWIKKERNE